MALALTDSIGPARFKALTARFGSARGALEAPFALLRTVPGISAAAATAISRRSVDDGLAVISQAAESGGRCLLPGDPEYPDKLRRIPDSPPLLFAAGDLTLLDRPAVAVVGSRDHTRYGTEVTAGLVRAACSRGLVVVSGMARGLDAVAHRAALECGGATIGVLGNGLGVIYPAANSELYRRVRRDGLLLTEFPPGDKPGAGSFPRRNRLISGLAEATVVVEAAVKSGTMITVETALAQGRDVLAVPGPITSPKSAGTNRLIRDGATPYLEPADLFQSYSMLTPGAPQTPSPAESRGRLAELDAAGRAVIDALGNAPVQLDVLAEVTRQPIAELQCRLLELELADVVEQLPGAVYLRKRV